MRVEGQILKWFSDKSYGFVSTPNDGADAFVHRDDFRDRGQNVDVGTRIAFDVHTSAKGLRASDAEVLS
jgi:cold shock CspA family protein